MMDMPSVASTSRHDDHYVEPATSSGLANGKSKTMERKISSFGGSTTVTVPCYTISNDDADTERAKSLLQDIATQFQVSNATPDCDIDIVSEHEHSNDCVPIVPHTAAASDGDRKSVV